MKSPNKNSEGNPSYDEWNNVLSDEYYKKTAETKESAPETLPTPEEKEKSLTFEAMSSLSTPEYLERWRTLNPFFVTHVTRQGIRDHNSMFYHSAGLGEFQDGFKSILKDSKVLKSPAEIHYGLKKDFTEADVDKMLNKIIEDANIDLSEWSAETIVDLLPVNCTMASAEPWSDKQAIHFAQHTVLNETYGGEEENEAFFVFPTDVIASQCRFGGHMHPDDLTTAQVSSERKWNDLFVWEDSARKIPIDAGLVFLPDSQPVDPLTGSKYATEEITTESGETIRVPVKDEEFIARFADFVKSLTPDSPELNFYPNGDYSIDALVSKFVEIGIPEKTARELLFGGKEYSFARFAQSGTSGNVYLSDKERAGKTEEEIKDLSIRNWLSSHNLGLKLAENPVPASEYWEKYFAEHPEEKPAHIIYYNGDPTKAVESLLSAHGILEKSEPSRDRDSEQVLSGPGASVERDGKLLGFDSHYVEESREDKELQSEHTRFNNLALKILKEKQSK